MPSRSHNSSSQSPVDYRSWQLVKRLLALSWQFKGRSLQVVILQLLLLAMTMGGLGLTGLAIDYLRYVLESGPVPHWPLGLNPPQAWAPMDVILAIGGGIAVLAILRTLLDYSYQMKVGKLVHIDIVLALRGAVYDKMQQLSFRFFDKNASGTLINRVTSDVQAVRLFIDQVLIQVFIMVLSLIVYLTYMMNIHVWLTLACLATTPLLWLLTAWFSKILHPAYLETRRLMDRMVLNFSESFQGIHTIKGFNLEENRQNSFRDQNEIILKQRKGVFWTVSTFGPGIGMLTQLNLVILLAYGGYLVIQGELPLGAGLVVFAGLLQQFSGQIANIAGIADSIQQSLTGARRVFEVLDTPAEIKSPRHPLKLGKVHGNLRFENVEFHYKPENIILRDIDFEAKSGEMIAIAGATGSGKSALMSLIPRFYDPTKGHIFLDGKDLRSLSVKDLRHNIGYVFQENFLFSQSVAQNIAFGQPNATREQIEKAAQIACAHEFIMEMEKGYDTLLTESGQNLSGGQRQRLAIARAILLEPPILLLDDPTAAIDPETEHEILEAIDRAIEGRTTFIVAHRLSTLRRADKVIVLQNGRILDMGKHEVLAAKAGLYREAVELQAVDPRSMELLQESRRQDFGHFISGRKGNPRS